MDLLVADKSKFAVLNGIRALAFLWVCGFHALIYGLSVDHMFGKDHDKWNEWNYFRFERPLLNIFSCGYLGVTVFLSLSGFLVTYVLHQKLGSDAGIKKTLFQFYISRFFRIWPALAVASFISQPLALWAQAEPFSAWHMKCSDGQTNLFTYWVRQVSFLTNFRNDLFQVGCKGTALFWTCSLEFQFYLTLPPLIILYARKSEKIGIALALMIFFLCLGLRLINIIHRYEHILHGEFSHDWYVASLQGDWVLYTRPWYRVSEYVAGILGYFAYLEIKPLQNTFGALLTKKESLILTPRQVRKRNYVQDEKKETSLSDTVVVDVSSDSDSDIEFEHVTASRADERRRHFLLKAIELLAAFSSFGFLLCRIQVARAAYNHSHHNNFNLWLSTHPISTILAATFESSLVAIIVAAACASMCGAGDQSALLLGLIRSFLSAQFWYPIASLSYTAYLISGVAISYERHRPAFASDGGFLARYLCFVLISLSFGLCLSIVIERPFMLIGKYLVAATNSSYHNGGYSASDFFASIHSKFMEAASLPSSSVASSA